MPIAVQGNSGGTQATYRGGNFYDVTTWQVAFPSNNVAGRMLFAVCGGYVDSGAGLSSQVHLHTIADNNGNTWTKIAEQTAGVFTGPSVAVFMCANCNAGPNTVTFTVESSNSFLPFLSYGINVFGGILEFPFSGSTFFAASNISQRYGSGSNPSTSLTDSQGNTVVTFFGGAVNIWNVGFVDILFAGNNYLLAWYLTFSGGQTITVPTVTPSAYGTYYNETSGEEFDANGVLQIFSQAELSPFVNYASAGGPLVGAGNLASV